MPSWGEILEEVQAAVDPVTNVVDVDSIRRRYLTEVHRLTGRSVVLYATDFLGKGGPNTQIGLADMQGLMEVFRQLPGPNLDLILHSPGGEAEATDRLVRYMRSKFDHIRVFVPLAAMSAATMLAMAADEIVMGKHSQLGPIDPQVLLAGGLPMPAGALIEQFEQATEECSKDPSRISGWLPTLQQYPPGLLSVCESADLLSRSLVAEWLQKYMLRGVDDAEETANEVAAWLGDHKQHLSHARAITIDELQSRGLRVFPLEEPQELQDAVLSVYHATVHTFGGSSATKIIENHLGRAYVQHGGQVMVLPPGVPPTPQNPVAPGPPPSPPRNQPRKQPRSKR